MGGSSSFDKIRQETISKRNKHLEQYRNTFQSIISKSGLTQKFIEHVVRSDVVEIVRLLNKKEVTSQQLIAIYGHRASTVGKDLCIITEDNFQFALKKAKQCDQERSKSGKHNLTIGEEWNQEKHLSPLFGVPVSIKDNIEMESTSATVGLSCRANQISKTDSPHIICMKSQGMIPFVKTNLPQLAFNFDSNNFLWGRSLNPWNNKKSVGGSSGGEGACLAAGISPVGVGNDMGGSIRIPAHFCGISGLMPSPHRLPELGVFTKYSTAFSGKDTITAVNGPMGRSIDSLALWMKIMTNEQAYQGKSDPYVKLHPFDLKLYESFQNKSKKLRIGYFNKLQMVECSPACLRALNQTVEFLKKEGNDLVEIKFPNELDTICCMFAELIGEGDFKAFTDMLEGQDLVEEYKNVSLVSQMNCCLFGMAKCVMNSTQPRMGIILNASRKLSTYEYQCSAGRVKELRQQWVDFWRAQNLDLLICPGFGMEAPNHGASNEGSILATYTFVWNILGMPVVATPITTVRQDEQRYESAWDDDITKMVHKSVVDSAGLPVGIQVVGLPFQEEKILGLAKRIESNFRFYQNYPLPINTKSK